MLSICYTVDHVKPMVIPTGGEVGRGRYLKASGIAVGRQPHTIGDLLLLPFGLTIEDEHDVKLRNRVISLILRPPVEKAPTEVDSLRMPASQVRAGTVRTVCKIHRLWLSRVFLEIDTVATPCWVHAPHAMRTCQLGHDRELQITLIQLAQTPTSS